MIEYTIESICSSVNDLEESWTKIQEIFQKSTSTDNNLQDRMRPVKDRIRNLQVVANDLRSREATSTDRINERLSYQIQLLKLEMEMLRSALPQKLATKLKDTMEVSVAEIERDSESLAGEVESFHGIMEDSFRYGLEEDDSYYSG